MTLKKKSLSYSPPEPLGKLGRQMGEHWHEDSPAPPPLGTMCPDPWIHSDVRPDCQLLFPTITRL